MTSPQTIAAALPPDHGDGPLVSVVIVSWNTRELLRACLHSVRQEALGLSGRVEVVVIDNASRDETAEMVRAAFPEVDLVRNAENVGFAAANNQGDSADAGTYVLLLNPDTESHAALPGDPGGLPRRAPEAGAVGPRVLRTAG